ncbi:PRC-barrel domain-containing protein [Methylopila sp. Yamaguchi]|uniref:PRC-barrel domain-containing protein n=1 Tax=Methylopila sp. Yamaguchi TaxID=1437817 RepID=UPI000CAF21A5|nr:PRC-barrel domain-containing protein [Methylopila sp. Yamaguchi]GBD49567.1 PRC-barrel domain-containing protein [Methylopila sp. Yamaguchi]
MASAKQSQHVGRARCGVSAPVSALNRRAASAYVLWAAAGMFAGLVGAAQAQAVRLVVVDVKTVGQGYQASKLIGAKVENDKSEKIGSLDDLIITKERELFAVLQVGGFLGLGGHLVAVPYASLNISDDGAKITLAGGSKEALGKLPEFQYKP